MTPEDPDLRTALLAGLGCPIDPDAALAAQWIDTPLGEMMAISDDHHLHLLEFPDRAILAVEMRRLLRGAGLALRATAVGGQLRAQLQGYFSGARPGFGLPLAAGGTPFQRRVWQELQRIPAGVTLSYGQLAARIGQPSAVRAVARANGANRLAVVIPCHRILGADGALTGYGGGLWRKQALIRHESVRFSRQAGQTGLSA